MLLGIIHKYQDHHAVKYIPTALSAAVDMSKHYFRELLLPGKAINLLDKAGGRACVLGRSHVTEAVMEDVIFMCRGLSTHKESDVLRARVGIRGETKPIGCFLFTVPSGVGKTEIARVLAREYFGSESAMVKLDMCQFMESNDLLRLMNLLAEAVRTEPHSLILFEEIEKADEKVLSVLVQMLDCGRLSDGKSKTAVDFSSTILIVTSREESRLKTEVVNRFDRVVALKPLEKEDIEKILDILIDEFRAKMKAKKRREVVVSEKLKEWLVRVGYDKRHGGRAIKRAFSEYVETVMADAFLGKDIEKYERLYW